MSAYLLEFYYLDCNSPSQSKFCWAHSGKLNIKWQFLLPFLHWVFYSIHIWVQTSFVSSAECIYRENKYYSNKSIKLLTKCGLWKYFQKSLFSMDNTLNLFFVNPYNIGCICQTEIFIFGESPENIFLAKNL